jgi:AcrR family transcriptional regulator
MSTSPGSATDAAAAAAVPARAGRAAAERAEPRALRTRTLVLDAVRAALAEMPVEALTVAEICRRAGVHRVTFYNHWADAEAAAAEALAGVIDAIATVDDSAIGAAGDPASLADLYEHALVAQFTELAAHRDAYRTLADAPLFERKLREALHARAVLAVEAMVASGVEIPGAASGIAAAQLAGGVVAASLEWLRSPATDAEEAAREVHEQLPRWWPEG